MGLIRTYYGIHQIVTGRYTAGGEYMLEDGTDYDGAYHVLPDGDLYTESRPRPTSKKLLIKEVGVSKDVIKYNVIKKELSGKYKIPVPIQPQPNQDDYEIGQIMRYFVQKRNNPFGTIAEIDVEQYMNINHENNPGINGVLWNKCNLFWKISKLPIEDIRKINTRTIIETTKTFPYLGSYLKNSSEFYK